MSLFTKYDRHLKHEENSRALRSAFEKDPNSVHLQQMMIDSESI